MTGMIANLLAQPWPRFWLDEVDSTNEEARRRIQRGDLGPAWVAARRQTAGRGRRGRTWVSTAGNLFATALFPFDETPQTAALTCFSTCIALRAAFEDVGCDVAEIKYKWPNDILWRGAKISGILIESLRHGPGVLAMAVGVGVNIVASPQTDQATARLHDLSDGAPPEPEALLERLSERFIQELSRLLSQGFEPTRAAWLLQAGALHQPVAVRMHDRVISGVFRDLDIDGAMILETEAGNMKRISAGDVQLLSE